MATNQTHADLIAKLQAAKRRGVPIAAINTPDQPALIKLLTEALNGKTPVLEWDFVRGIHANNEAGIKAMADLGGEESIRDTQLSPLAPIMALSYALRMPSNAVLFYYNAQRFVQDAGVCQGLMNLRDEFKHSQRMIVLVGSQITLPPEIMNDVVQFTDPLPSDERLLEIVGEQVTAAVQNFEESNQSGAAKKLRESITPDVMKKAAVALRSCSAFGAEQLTALSLRPGGIEIDDLHTQAKAMIETTPGLTFERGSETFNDICGLNTAREFGQRLFAGPEAPAVVLRVEELEKSMAGAKGDLSGVSGDALQVLLTSMEDNGFNGMLAYGCAGSGKSLFAKAMANTFGAKALRFDMNACRGSLVGQSETMIRKAMQVISALGGRNVFIVASCNKLEAIPPELQRRFLSGVWFFDLPTEEGRKAMWKMYRAKYKIAADEPDCDEPELTGADIRNICKQAYSLSCSLAEARRYIVPLKSQSPQSIADARAMAEGRFTCASRGGVYSRAKIEAKQGRKVQV